MPEKQKIVTKTQPNNWVAIGSFMPKIVADAIVRTKESEVKK